MNSKKIILFNGSPRRKKTSYSFARTLKKLTEDKGNTAEIINIIDYCEQKQSFEKLREIINQSDIIGLVAPLYVDTLPYPAIWFLEELSNKIKEELEGKSFFAIGQCGFPDIKLIEPLIGSCKCFADKTRMKWLGGLSYGGGAILDGAHMEDLGKKGEKITSGLSIALESIIKEEDIPSKAQDLLTIKIPKILYRPLAEYLNFNSRRIAKKNGVTDIERKFYL